MDPTDSPVQSPEVTFREIGPDHDEELTAFLERNNVPAVVRTFNPFPMTAETAQRIASTPRLDHYYGAFSDDGRIVGLSMLRGWDEGYDVPSFGIMVDQRFQGMGIGARMLDYTIVEGARLGCRGIRLSVFASNQGAAGLYLSRGFVETERQPALVAGEPDERIVMFKDLSA